MLSRELKFTVDILNRAGIKHRRDDRLARLKSNVEERTLMNDAVSVFITSQVFFVCASPTKRAHLEFNKVSKGPFMPFIQVVRMMASITKIDKGRKTSSAEFISVQSFDVGCFSALVLIGKPTSRLTVGSDRLWAQASPSGSASQEAVPAALSPSFLSLCNFLFWQSMTVYNGEGRT